MKSCKPVSKVIAQSQIKKKQPACQQSESLDIQYLHLREEIANSPFYVQTTQHNKIKFTHWFQKLDKNLSQLSWKQNRNNYAKVLYLMAMCGTIQPPFARLPPEGELPLITNSHMNAIIDAVERHVQKERAQYGSCNACSTEKYKQIGPMHSCSTKHSYCSSQQHSFLNSNRTIRGIFDQQVSYFRLYQQLELNQGENSFIRLEKDRTSFGTSTEKQQFSTVLAKRPPKSRYSLMYQSRPKRQRFRENSGQLINNSDSNFTINRSGTYKRKQEKWDYDEQQIEEKVRTSQVRKCSYFIHKPSSHVRFLGAG